MANNLVISYDLHAPDKNYEAVAKAIKELGNWAKVHKSVWYVSSHYTAAQARDHVWKSMDANDTVIVVNATANDAAWQNLSKEVADFIRDKWHKMAA